MTLPMAARVSVPQSDVRWKMRAAVQRNHARIMNHFSNQNDVPRPLHKLVVTVVTGRIPAQSGDAVCDTPQIVRKILWIVGRRMLSHRRGSGLTLLPLSREWYLPVRRVGDERRSVLEMSNDLVRDTPSGGDAFVPINV